MYFRTIEGFIDHCELTGIAGPNTRRGCSEQEIQMLEEQCGVTLPHSYRAFLAAMGHNAGRVLESDTRYRYDFVLEVNKDFPEYVSTAEEGARVTNWPDHALVIASYLFAQNWVIRCNDPHDSPVWRLDLDEGGDLKLTQTSFVEWLYTGGW